MKKKFLSQDDVSLYCLIVQGKKTGNVSVERAKEILIDNYRSMIYKTAVKYAIPGQFPEEDAFMCGVIGFLRAVELYDTGKGVRLSTYSTFQIVAHITRERRESRFIHLPAHISDDLKKWYDAVEFLSAENEEEPSDSEVAKYLRWTEEKTRKIRLLPACSLSLDEKCSDKTTGQGGNYNNSQDRFNEIFSDGSLCMQKIQDDKMYYEDFADKILSSMTKPQERDLICMRIGIFPYDRPYSMEEIAKKYGVTRECIRQRENNIVASLRRRFAPECEKISGGLGRIADPNSRSEPRRSGAALLENKKRNDKMRAEYRSGKPLEQLTKEYGLPRSSVQRIVRGCLPERQLA